MRGVSWKSIESLEHLLKFCCVCVSFFCRISSAMSQDIGPYFGSYAGIFQVVAAGLADGMKYLLLLLIVGNRYLPMLHEAVVKNVAERGSITGRAQIRKQQLVAQRLNR